METPEQPVDESFISELLASASANHDRLKHLEDVIAALSKTADESQAGTPGKQATSQPNSASSCLKDMQASFADWRPAMVGFVAVY